MGKKSLKVYNETTREWELISTPDVSVEVRLPDGAEITDNDVKITNSKYVKEDEEVTLNDVLGNIDDDITRLQRNVSWLDAHKGEGGGGGGGGSTSYKIKIISPNPENGNVYINSNEIRVQFTITGPESDDSCSYAYQFDEEPISDYIPVKANEHVYLPSINIPDGLAYHTLTIKAINPYGINISPVSINIYKSTLKIAFDESAAGESYSNLTYYIKSNVKTANVPFLITNGMQDAEVTLFAEYRAGSRTESISLGKLPSATVTRNFNFWQIIPKSQVITNLQYVIEFYATSIVGTHAAESNRVALRIAVINPDELTIIMGVNGSSEPGQIIPTDSIAYYNFKISAPIATSSAYYAAKIVNITKDTSYLILGKYFDENTKISGCTYSDNPVTERETTISSSYHLSENYFDENDVVKIVVKAWNFRNPQDTAETEYEFTIGAVDNNIYPRQYKPRHDGDVESDTLLFSWNKNNAVYPNVPRTKWISDIMGYNAIDVNIGEHITAEINVENNNAASGMVDGDIPYMRLQNRAFATADVSNYASELNVMTQSRDNTDGFTISITLAADNTTDNNHTLFLWGINNPDGTLLKGIRIDSDKVYWTIDERTSGGNITTIPLSCNFSCGTKETIDFSFIRNSYTSVITLDGGQTIERITYAWTASIYVNGIMNAATDIYELSDDYKFPSTIYFGTNIVNEDKNRFSDANFYEFSVYTKALNDMQISINGKNARLNGRTSEEAVIADYNAWKAKNFIRSDETDPSKPLSVFFEEGKYKTSFNSAEVSDIAQKSTIPALWIRFGADDDFTYDFFYSKHTTDVTSIRRSGTASYYDPETNRLLTDFNIWLSLQGTTTLGYRVKNVELYMRDTFRKDAKDYPYLFQPKKDWFPESQFTIKADVVDSAHANNAVLGEWINKSGMLENNPVMSVFNPNTRPKDINDSGEPQQHMGSGGTMIDYDEDVSIKHTLEGFPILLFIKFSDKENYEFIGIYSFNLGRYSYYNMGMKFLKSFSARDDSGNRLACPRIIKYYEETETLGGIDSNNVYSFEFGNGGNNKVIEHPVWSQYDISVLQNYGEFKYPSNIGNTDLIWTKLGHLFESTAKFTVDSYNGDVYDKYDHIKYYTINAEGKYVTNGQEIQQTAESSEISGKLNINNAVAYFIIVNAFGMTDSLGKNMVLRTWDGGNTWWVCFYDMDTALGLSNDGAEDVPVTVSIDKIVMESSPESGSIMSTIYHDDNSRYAAVYAKLWGILRCYRFLYQSQGEFNTYEYVWNTLRKSGGKLAYAENFTTMMEERIATCGEIMYNYDYNQKYIQGSAGSGEEGEVEPAINFLHGTRINYVRDWLKKHFYYLDGIFPVNRVSGGDSFDFTNTDSVYNRDQVAFSVNYSGAISILPFTVQVSTPAFIGISIGNDPFKQYYIDTPNADTMLYCSNSTSSNSQIIIKGSSLITKFNGLQGAFIQTMSNEAGCVRAMTAFDISGSNILSNNPFNPNIFLYRGNSSLESLNVSGSHGGSGALPSYDINVENFDKLIYLDCHDSDVTSIELPSTSLKYLNVSNSNITRFALRSQNSITEIDFTGCKKLTSIELDDCGSIEEITLEGMRNLNSISFKNCASLRKITVLDCTNISSVEIFRNQNLREINISGIAHTGTTFNINGCTSLISLSLNDIQSTKFVDIDTISAYNIQNVNLDRFYNFIGFRYDGFTPEIYDDSYVVNLSPMAFIENGSFAYCANVRYLRVPNDSAGVPFKIHAGMFASANAITRIFGYIDICEPAAFSNCVDFYLNDLDAKYDDDHAYDKLWLKEEVGFVESTYDSFFTNIKISTSSLDEVFKDTNVNIGDVYNVFRNCSDSIISMKNTFRSCANIYTSGDETEPDLGSIDKNIFRYCTNITDVDGLFRDCTNINGIIWHDIMDFITPKITSFAYVFPSQVFFDKDYPLFKEGNNITRIDGFVPQFCSMSDLWRVMYVSSDELLANCGKVISIKDSFNSPTAIELPSNGEMCGLLKGLTGLTSIFDSLNLEITPPYTSICDGLICDPDDLSNYSSRLETISGSFNFIGSGSYDIPKIYLGNNFFTSCKARIKTITESFEGIEKIIKKTDTYGLNDDMLNFPYKIFSGCTNLETVENFFSGLNISNYNPAGEGINENILITLPSYIYNNGDRIDIFGDCANLKNISGCFNGMKYGRYQLVSDGFKNNSLRTVNKLFAEMDNRECYKVGEIPYHLFYQEKNGAINATIKSMDSLFEGTVSSAVSCYHCDVSHLSSLRDFAEPNPNYGEEDETKFIWNIYLNDGTDKLLTTIQSLTDYGRLQTLYAKIAGGEDISDYVDLLDENNKPLYPKELPEEMYDFIDASAADYRDVTTLNYIDIGYAQDYMEYFGSIISTYFGIQNYICAPDLFRYCSNDIGISINAVFKNCSDGIVNGTSADGYCQGYYGKMPYFMFKPISNLLVLESFFQNFKMLLPHRWATLEDGVTKTFGSTYNPKMFKYAPNIEYTTDLFRGTIIWGRTEIKGIFDNIAKLKTASGLWKTATWLGINDDEARITVNMFYACTSLYNVSSMFENTGPAYMFDSIFNASMMKINDCSGFMKKNSSTYKGSIPQFWNFPNIQYKTNTYSQVNNVWDSILEGHPDYR